MQQLCGGLTHPVQSSKFEAQSCPGSVASGPPSQDLRRAGVATLPLKTGPRFGKMGVPPYEARSYRPVCVGSAGCWCVVHDNSQGGGITGAGVVVVAAFADARSAAARWGH